MKTDGHESCFTSLLVLGAGRPHRGTVPAALRRDHGGVPVLEWLADAFGVNLSRVTFVGGYGIDAVRKKYPSLEVIVPPDWDRTGSAESFLTSFARIPVGRECSKPDLGLHGQLDVVYGDVMLRRKPVAALPALETGCDADVVVAWDSQWRGRFPGRLTRDLKQREKVVLAGERIVQLGRHIAIEDASGEFVGFVRFGPNALTALAELRDSGQRQMMCDDELSDVVQSLVAGGLRVVGVDFAGEWAEIDAPADIARFVLGTKADTLARLERTITIGKIADQVTFTVDDWKRDVSGVTSRLEERFAGRPLIVRSSTTHEDLFAASNAGGFVSVLDVCGTAALEEAVDHVITSYDVLGVQQSDQQILVQPMIDDVFLSGVVLTRTLNHGAPWRTIEYSVGASTETVTSGSGSEAGRVRTLVVNRDVTGAEAMRSHATLEMSIPEQERRDLARVILAVDEVERLLSYDALDIEFAVDRSGDVHVLQVRPLATSPEGLFPDLSFRVAMKDARRSLQQAVAAPENLPEGLSRPLRAIYGVMPDWNPAEIIGTAPGQLAVDLYCRLVTDEVWAQQRVEFGYRDLRPVPLLQQFAGRPYIDVRASFASFIPAEINDRTASRLLAASLERLANNPTLHDKVEFEVVPTSIDPNWERWNRQLMKECFAKDERDQLRIALARITSGAFARVESDLGVVTQLRGECADAVRGVSDPLRRAARLLEVTARFGTLPFAHLARSAFVAVSLLRGAEAQGVISREAVAGFLGELRTSGHGLTEDARAVAHGTLPWAAFVQRWGHLRPGTYEVMSPRYDADPERFLRPLVLEATIQDIRSGNDGERSSHWHAERGAFFAALERIGLPSNPDVVERFMRTAIEGREWSKFEFTRPLSNAIEDLVIGWEMRGVVREDLADAPLGLLLPHGGVGGTPEVLVDAGSVQESAARGREQRRVTAATPFAPLLCAEDDLDAFLLTAGTPNFVGVRAVTAPIIELFEGDKASPDVAGCIVLIPRADPGFDWLFGHRIAGLITLYGGANSHMTIRAAEFGLSAAIGVGVQRYEQLRTAAAVELDPMGHTLRVLR